MYEACAVLYNLVIILAASRHASAYGPSATFALAPLALSAQYSAAGRHCYCYDATAAMMSTTTAALRDWCILLQTPLAG